MIWWIAVPWAVTFVWSLLAYGRNESRATGPYRKYYDRDNPEYLGNRRFWARAILLSVPFGTVLFPIFFLRLVAQGIKAIGSDLWEEAEFPPLRLSNKKALPGEGDLSFPKEK